MGREAEARVHVGGRVAVAKVLLETDALIVRGPLRLKIPLDSVRRVAAVGGRLRVEHGQGVAEFELGRAAARWAEAILHPKGRLDKLGVKAGQRVVVLGLEDADFRRELQSRTRHVGERAHVGADAIFLAAGAPADLGALSRLSGAIARDGAVWVVYPKGRTEIREAHVLEAGRSAGLKDVKVVRFSATHSALKFVIPLARR